jgi:microcystin-dependent protein
MAAYLGEIRLFAGTFPPAGWAFCDGATLPISENDSLFTLLGTTYGGDGQSTFRLPDLQSRLPVHQGTGPNGATFTLAEMAGTEEETLTVQQIPAHTHPMLASTDVGQAITPKDNVLGAGASVSIFRPGPATTPQDVGVVQAVGGSQPHDNMHPFVCINYIIALFGIFPQPT